MALLVSVQLIGCVIVEFAGEEVDATDVLLNVVELDVVTGFVVVRVVVLQFLHDS